MRKRSAMPSSIAAEPRPEKPRDAIVEAKRITNFEGKRRQKQFIGKLMHRLDAEALEAVAAALRVQRSQSAQDVQRLHRAEKWRDALIADDAQLGPWLEEYPGTDAQQLRALIRQARKDSRESRPGESQRQGRAYRQLFALVREQISSSAGTPS